MSLDYGIIGNCRTCALVKSNAAIEWLCLPRFDSPSVFGRLLDPKAGRCVIQPLGRHEVKQYYVHNTAILKTHFSNPEGAFSIVDFFPKFTEKPKPPNHLIRCVKLEKGKPIMRIMYEPRPDYSRGDVRILEQDGQLVAKHAKQNIYLRTSLPLKQVSNVTFPLENDFFMVISDEPIPAMTKDDINTVLRKTATYWEYFVKQTTTPMKYREQVVRSAITLKLLQYAPTGAFVAAPTTSLPEISGGVRNWDYRYCWLRDAAFTVNAFTGMSKFEETAGFMNFLETICQWCTKQQGTPHMQIMYGIDGRHKLPEQILDHLQGFRNSKPVRIGNAAYEQQQLDVAGEVLEALSFFYARYQYADRLPDTVWNLILMLVKQIQDTWQKKDNGLWEFRNIKEHFTHSKLMCWMGMKSAIDLARAFDKQAPFTEWKQLRDAIKEEILAKAWNEKKQAFTMYYESDALDASVLLMPLLGFIDANDPRMKSTIKAIEKELRDGCCFVFRYKKVDDFGQPVNSFTLCSFWLVQALHMMGEQDLAKEIFEHLLTHTNHLGLYSEGLNPRTGELTGNFPQAFTHVAVVNTAGMLASKNHNHEIGN